MSTPSRSALRARRRGRPLSRRLAALAAGLVALPVAAVVAIGGAPATYAAGCSTGTATVALQRDSAVLGGTLGITGAGWCHPDGGGSVVAVKLDAGAYSHLDSRIHANRTIWAIVTADADGSFDTEITLPDGTAGTSEPAFPAGGHTLTLLSGSVKTGDTVRSVTSEEFTATAAPPAACDPDGAATAKVSGGSALFGGVVRFSGEGWCEAADDSSVTGSTVVVRLDRGDYRRPDDSVSPDRSVWAVVRADDSGHLSGALTLPDGTDATSTPALAAGGHRLQLVSGDDGERSAETGAFTVRAPGACTATARTAVTIHNPQVPVGGVLHVTGTGWCHPTDGGSVIGVKLDDGAYSHLDTRVSANRTTWAIVDADAHDGTFDARIQLPDGTARTSTPAFPTGAHTLRLLTGTLKAGDTVRTVKSAEFVVGAYRPNGIPDPVDPARLSTGVTATLAGHRLKVTVTGGAAGDWVFLSGLAPDGSPRYPWGERWFRLGAGGKLVVGLGKVPLAGENRVVVQSGNLGEVGKLLGWDTVVFPGAPATAAPGGGSPAAAAAPAAGAARGTSPASPVGGYGDLQERDRLLASLVGSVWSARVPDASGPLFVYVYAADRTLPAGWIMADDKDLIRVDLRRLPPAAYRLTVQDGTGTLLGWGNADLTPAAPAAAEDSDQAPGERRPPVAAVATAAPKAGWLADHLTATDGWMLGLGGTLLLGLGLGLLGRRGGVA